MLHAGKRGESIAQGAVDLLRALRIETAEARVDFEEQIVFDVQSGLERGRIVRSANEKGRGREERERESNLDNDERIAREKTPASPDDIIPGMLLQIADDAMTRKLHRRAEGEGDGA